MKNYIKYLPLLFACFLAGCLASQKDARVENLVLDVAEVVVYGQDKGKAPTEIIVQGKPEILEVIEFKLGKHAQFEFNSTELTAEGRDNLGDIAQELRKYPDAIFTIVGHTDNTGEENYNNMLSEQRAETIRQTLRDRYGINNQIEILGKGPSEPKESNDTLAGRQANRRAEVQVAQ